MMSVQTGPQSRESGRCAGAGKAHSPHAGATKPRQLGEPLPADADTPADQAIEHQQQGKTMAAANGRDEGIIGSLPAPAKYGIQGGLAVVSALLGLVAILWQVGVFSFSERLNTVERRTTAVEDRTAIITINLDRRADEMADMRTTQAVMLAKLEWIVESLKNIQRSTVQVQAFALPPDPAAAPPPKADKWAPVRRAGR